MIGLTTGTKIYATNLQENKLLDEATIIGKTADRYIIDKESFYCCTNGSFLKRYINDGVYLTKSKSMAVVKQLYDHYISKGRKHTIIKLFDKDIENIKINYPEIFI